MLRLVFATRLQLRRPAFGTAHEHDAMTDAGDAPTADRPRILVVDDDAEIVALLTRYLSGHGFEVAGAANGAQLRTSIGEAATDLVLLDLGLPDEDGLSLLRYLQAQWRGPVIVISGRGDELIDLAKVNLFR